MAKLKLIASVLLCGSFFWGLNLQASHLCNVQKIEQKRQQDAKIIATGLQVAAVSAIAGGVASALDLDFYANILLGGAVATSVVSCVAEWRSASVYESNIKRLSASAGPVLKIQKGCKYGSC